MTAAFWIIALGSLVDVHRIFRCSYGLMMDAGRTFEPL